MKFLNKSSSFRRETHKSLYANKTNTLKNGQKQRHSDTATAANIKLTLLAFLILNRTLAAPSPSLLLTAVDFRNVA